MIIIVNKLISILKNTQEELKKYLENKLLDFYSKDNIYSLEGGIIAFGNLPLTLLAHLDVKKSEYPKEILIEDGIIRSNDHILGGDDRCGVAIILQLLEDGDRPNIIFTEDEEVGCIGVYKLMRNKSIFEELINRSNYLLQLDRREKNDYVTYDSYNDELNKLMEETGFIYKTGTSTDIRHISNNYNIASCNVSVGYYNEHTINEYVVIDEFIETYKKVKVLLNNIPSSRLENFNF
ncbi:MAG: hypothetical protein SOW55_05930 [Bacilli bacterium]|nr:hypothetical protein [Bacillales bacterium]MDY2575486.1 hypothetical protein [Bacilli bacterium]